MNKNDYQKPDKDLAAICGLFCVACDNFIDTVENQEKLAKKAEKNGRSLEDCLCRGCRSDTLNYFCRENCYMKACAEKKKVDFCGECDEFPCAELKEFQAARPHRIELWKNHERIVEAGFETWHSEMLEHYSCPQCGTINSAYDLRCRECGAEPSCEYAKKHHNEIVKFLEQYNSGAAKK